MFTLTQAGRDAIWKERAATIAIFLSLGLVVGAWAADLPRFKAELDLSDRDLSLALLALAIGSVAATIATGVLAPRYGTGRSTGIAALAMVAVFILPGSAATFTQFVICAALVGVTFGAIDIAVNGHASDIERRWTSPLMSSFHAAFSLGGLFGSALGGVLAAAGWSVAGQLWGSVAIAALAVGCALPFLGSGARTGHGAGFALPERSALGLCAIALFCFLIEGAMADWSGVYLATVAHASPPVAASGYAAFSIAMTGGRLVGDSIVAALGARRVVLLGGSVVAAGLALAIADPEPVPAALGFALVGLGAANIVPVMFSAAGRFGSSPSAGVAMVATFGYAGFIGGPPLIGMVATWAGLQAGLVVLLAAAASMALAGLGLDRAGKPA